MGRWVPVLTDLVGYRGGSLVSHARCTPRTARRSPGSCSTHSATSPTATSTATVCLRQNEISANVHRFFHLSLAAYRLDVGALGVQRVDPPGHRLAQERLTIHIHEALCSQETRPHRQIRSYLSTVPVPVAHPQLTPAFGLPASAGRKFSFRLPCGRE